MPTPKKHFDTNCPFCGQLAPGRNKYCSVKCQMDFQSQQKLESWLSGEVEGGSQHGVSAPVRRWLLEKACNKCEKCSWCEVHPITGKPPLEVNHIDGNALNHRPENLEILCPNCHSLTPTFKALNKGNGTRTFRAPFKHCGDAAVL